MMRAIGNAMSLATVAAALLFAVAATFGREIGTLEGMLFWKAGILGLVFFAFKTAEAASPSAVSILDETRLSGRE